MSPTAAGKGLVLMPVLASGRFTWAVGTTEELDSAASIMQKQPRKTHFLQGLISYLARQA